jgi:hypothetical protein
MIVVGAAEVMIPSKEFGEKTYISHFESSKDSHRTFCGRCGTHLTFHYSGKTKESMKHWGPILDISTGSLDTYV